MKARKVFENLDFERGKDPREALNIGIKIQPPFFDVEPGVYIAKDFENEYTKILVYHRGGDWFTGAHFKSLEKAKLSPTPGNKKNRIFHLSWANKYIKWIEIYN